MRAWLVRRQAPVETHPMRLEEVPVPRPGPGQVRLRVRTCGVCHTDLHVVEGDLAAMKLPVVPGHQVVGVIDAVGPGVDSAAEGSEAPPAPQVGRRVGVPWLHRSCGACSFCRRGEENLCEDPLFTGWHVDGGYAEYVVADARFLVPIPDTFDDLSAAPLLCAGIIGYRSLRLSDLQPGERLLLVGFGASAHLALQVACAWGCEVWVRTRSAAHRRLARELGATWCGGPEETPPGAADRAVIFAPSGELVPPTLAALRKGGTLAINAIHMSDIPRFPYHLVYGERTVRSVTNATRQDAREFMALAAEIGVRTAVERVPFERADTALVALKRREVQGAAVLQAGGSARTGGAVSPVFPSPDWANW